VVNLEKGWVVLSCLIGVVLAAAIAIATYPFMQIIAAHGQGTIDFENDTLRWQVGRNTGAKPLSGLGSLEHSSQPRLVSTAFGGAGEHGICK